MGTSELRDRDVTSVLVRALLAYLRRAGGEALAGEVVQEAGLDPADPRLSRDDEWMSGKELAALVEVAARRCGDPALGWKVGEEYFRMHTADGTVEFLRAEGTPDAALALSAQFASKMSMTRRYVVRDTLPTSVIVESYAHGRAPTRFDCQLAGGYWARIPGLFGAVGTVIEPMCMARGDERCELIVSWDRPVELEVEQRTRSESLADRTVSRFENLQSMAAEMATAKDVRTVLERIIGHVSSAMMAPRFVLTVRRTESSPADVLAVGFDDDVAVIAADALWAGEPGLDFGTPLVAEVASDLRQYGYLAAYLPPGATSTEVEHRLLRAYAGHATAALERVVLLETAQRDHNAATSLLGLAQSLAGVGSIAEIADHVAETVTDVLSCELAGVWLLDEAGTGYRLQSLSGEWNHRGPSAFAVDRDHVSMLTKKPQPFVLARSDGDPFSREILEAWGVEESYAAPIVHRGTLHGLVAAGSTNSAAHADRAFILDRLMAMASHASTAIGNRLLLEQIRHQALHDGLTGLPNRPQIEDQTRTAMAHAARTGNNLALAFIDLDRFKNVNDTLGHAAGDDLIQLVAHRLERSVRTTDVVARLGGDEFLVMLPDVADIADAETVAEKVLSALEVPFEVADETLFVSASIGIACYPEHGTDYGTLLARADGAMYEAKAKGRNRYATHAQAPRHRHRSLLKIENELHFAIERDELRLLYQPQVDLTDERIVAVEALIRWHHPRMGEMSPGSFLAIAEDSGLIVDIDRWVRRQAFEQAARWRDAGTPVRIAVNMSSRDLQNPGLPGELDELMRELALPPSLVEIEITDRIVMSDDDLPGWLASLHELGVRLAVDDFGTGNSVLSRLQSCPVDVLKIDRSFITALTGPDADTRLVHALVSMSHVLALEVVSEGIETAEQAEILRGFGCDLGQGFHFHRPMQAAALADLLASTRPGDPRYRTAPGPPVLPAHGDPQTR